ncbi:hypothetical protein ABK040_007296 [Willaertia magna]
MEIIKLSKDNNNKNERIKQICAGSNRVSFVTESGKLFMSGKHQFSVEKSLQQVPKSFFNNESIDCISDNLTSKTLLILTKLRSIYIVGIHGMKQLNLNNQLILQIYSAQFQCFILTEGNSIYSVSTELNSDDYILKEINLNDLIKTESSIDKEIIKNVINNKNSYKFYLIGESNNLIISFYKKQIYYFIDKKKFNNLIENKENKNVFCDIKATTI